MSILQVIRASVPVSDFLFRRAFPLYAVAYDTFKHLTERATIETARHLVRPGDTAVDIGANIGFYTRLLADWVGPSGRVYAFEPEAENFSRLQDRLRGRAQVEAVQAAVCSRTGTVNLYRSPRFNVDHRTYATDDSRVATPTPAVSLDTYLPAGTAVDFIKMDIQGAEYDALRGMQDTVARSPRLRIVMELWPFVHDRFGGGTAALLALIESWGFAAYRIGSGGYERLARDGALPEQNDADAFFDILCARPATVEAR